MNIRHIAKKIKKLPKYFWPLTPWTALFAALVLVVCAEASALIIHHQHATISKPPVTTTSKTPQVITKITSTSTPSSPVASSQPAAKPVACNAEAADTLHAKEKGADNIFVYTVQGILSQQSSLSDADAVSQFNQAILQDSGTYDVAYANYVNTERIDGCPIAVSQRPSLPLCYPANLDSFSVTTCISNTHLED
jgi:hypothetical protein